jgi:serine/threonine-protein kinase HipA
MIDIHRAGLSALLVQIETPQGELIDVGYLYNSEPKNWFEISESYWSLPNRPVLGQVFEEHGRLWKPSAHVALPHWFSHLLPEGRLREAVAAAAGTSSVREFNILARIGIDDLPGALHIGPAEELGKNTIPPELAAAEDTAGDLNPLLKFSLAGAQMKFSIYRDGKGLTVPLKGQAGNVIAKLPDGRPGYSGVPQAELGSLELARLSGIDAPSASLVSISDIAGLEDWSEKVTDLALAVDRFDRGPSGRIHMEELAQILNIPSAVQDAKYLRANFETIANVVGGLCGPDLVGEIITRIVFNVLVGNGDAHLKNWAVLYPDGVNPALSPIYDVLPTVLYIPNDNLGLKLAGSRSFEAVTESSFDKIGAVTGFGVDKARAYAKDATERTLVHWNILTDYLSLANFQRLTDRLTALELTKRALF